MKSYLSVLLFLLGTNFFVLGQLNYLSNRGMYLNGANDYITTAPDLTLQLEVLQYCKDNGITYLLLDGMSGETSADVFNTSENSDDHINDENAVKLSNFINLSKNYGVEEIGVGIESENGIHGAANYDRISALSNIQQSLVGIIKFNTISKYTGKINIVSLQFEFWNMDGIYNTPAEKRANIGLAYEDCVSLLQVLADAQAEFPENYIRSELYLGELDRDDRDDDAQAQELASLCDRILMTKYTTQLSLIFSTGTKERFQNFGANTAKKIEIWQLQSATIDAQGYILTNNPSYSTYDRIEDKWRNDFNSAYSSGEFVGKDNFYVGGFMWYSYQDGKQFNANPRNNSVTLGAHIRKGGADCPIPLKAQAKGISPFRYTWRKEDGTLIADITNSALPYNVQLITGVGKFFVTVTDAAGIISSDYVIIYSDYKSLYPCSSIGSGSLSSANTNNNELNHLLSPNETIGVNVTTVANELVATNFSSQEVNIIAVFNSMGQKMHLPEYKLGKLGSIRLPSLVPGVYIIHFKNENGEIKFQKFTNL